MRAFRSMMMIGVGVMLLAAGAARAEQVKLKVAVSHPILMASPVFP